MALVIGAVVAMAVAFLMMAPIASTAPLFMLPETVSIGTRAVPRCQRIHALPPQTRLCFPRATAHITVGGLAPRVRVL